MTLPRSLRATNAIGPVSTARRITSARRSAVSGAVPAQQDGELVSSEAVRTIVLAAVGRERLRHDAQSLVADVVAERVVDRLEVIDVDEDQRHRLIVVQLLDIEVEGATAQQAGDRIVLGLVAKQADRLVEAIAGGRPGSA